MIKTHRASLNLLKTYYGTFTTAGCERCGIPVDLMDVCWMEMDVFHQGDCDVSVVKVRKYTNNPQQP